MTTIKERFLQVLEFKRLGKRDFCEKIGMTYGNFTGEAKKTPLNSIAIGNILSLLPDVSPEWLIVGDGEMLKTKSEDVPTPGDSGSAMDKMARAMEIMAESNKILAENNAELVKQLSLKRGVGEGVKAADAG